MILKSPISYFIFVSFIYVLCIFKKQEEIEFFLSKSFFRHTKLRLDFKVCMYVLSIFLNTKKKKDINSASESNPRKLTLINLLFITASELLNAALASELLEKDTRALPGSPSKLI